MYCDAVYGGEKFVHCGDHGDFRTLPCRAKTLVVGAQPRIDADGNEDRHPQRAPQTSITERHYAFPGILSFSGMMDTWDDTHVTGESCRIAETGRISCLGNYRGGRKSADTRNRSE